MIPETFIREVLHGKRRADELDAFIADWRTKPEDPFGYELAHALGLSPDEYRIVESATDAERQKAFDVIVADRRARNDDRRRTLDGDPINPDMGEGRYQDKLRTLRAAIAGGLELQLLDDTFPGDKTTYATWGLCTNSPEVYGSKNDHIFPEAFEARHRITERSPPEGASCPLDRGTVKDEYKLGSSGCFFRCRLFKPLPRNAVESRESALKRYDLLIEKREAQFGRKTTADDNEQGW